MTRSTSDAAFLLQAIAGFDPRDPSSADVAVPNYMAALSGDVRGLRIGVPRADFFEECAPVTLAAVEAAIEKLRDLGAVVIDCDLPDTGDTLLFGRAILRIEAAAYHADRLREHPELFSARLREMLEGGGQFSGVQYLQAQLVRTVIAKRFVAAIAPHDALVMPTTPSPPSKIDTDLPSLTGLRMRNTMRFNFTGLPAISTPLRIHGGRSSHRPANRRPLVRGGDGAPYRRRLRTRYGMVSVASSPGNGMSTWSGRIAPFSARVQVSRRSPVRNANSTQWRSPCFSTARNL